MSFTVKYGRMTSPTNAVNKEVQWLTPDLTGILRDQSSLIDPVIMIQASAPGFHANDVNYLYVEDFGRYYYITNIISVNETLWEIHCHVDVLMSYKEDILEQTAIVARQEGKYNMYLDDGIFMTYQNPKVQLKTFSNPTPFETQEFVLIVAGS